MKKYIPNVKFTAMSELIPDNLDKTILDLNINNCNLKY